MQPKLILADTLGYLFLIKYIESLCQYIFEK